MAYAFEPWKRWRDERPIFAEDSKGAVAPDEDDTQKMFVFSP